MRKKTMLPCIGTELQSSEAPRVTTETIMGCLWGEYSKQSLAHRSSRSRTCSTPASNVEANATLTLALSRKFSLGGAKSATGELSLAIDPPGSVNKSVLSPARMDRLGPGSTFHS